MRFYLRNDFGDRPGLYYVCWTVDGRPRRASCRTRDFAAAQAALGRFILEHDKPRDQLAEQVTVVSVLLRYWQHHGRELASADTVKATLAGVTRHLPLTTVAELENDELQQRLVEGLREDGIAENTIDRRIGVVQAALHWAKKRKELTTIPTALARPNAHDGPGAAPCTPNQLNALFAAAKLEHQRRFLMLALGTAGRPISLLDLTWDRIDFEAGTVDLVNPRVKQTKKRRARVPMAPALASFLASRKGVGPVIQWRDRALEGHKTMFGKLAEAAGVEVGAYSLRSTTASWLRRKQVPEWDVRALMGHAKTITDRYAHYDPTWMAGARAAIGDLFASISAGWLAEYLPVPYQSKKPPEAMPLQMAVSAGFFGGRTWDRTTDPYHVKAGLVAEIQALKAANDD